MPKTVRIVLIAVLLAIAAVLGWWVTHRPRARTELTLYGNVDLRQIDLAFNDTQRVARVLVQEGDRVHQGQILASLDTGRLEPQAAQAAATAEAQQQVVDRLRHGNRPEEIAQARANVVAATADADNARAQLQRLQTLADSSAGRAVSRQDLDAARTAVDTAVARLQVNQKALALEVAGPRHEDVAQAEAQLRADQAALALLQQQLRDAQLRAPLDAIVRSRIAEPGDMSSPQKAAFTLAIMDPKWVRAYVDEPDLGAIREGVQAGISVDAFPGRSFPGWVGFISPVAEFTPKSVETTQLRSSLVYEVRVFVKDPDNDLRLGMPATVNIPLSTSQHPGSDGH